MRDFSRLIIRYARGPLAASSGRPTRDLKELSGLSSDDI